ncbi:MAG: amidohydrolase family protein [Parasphingorhabdus sp.]|nr:amidohydrolase family protein [Parasphingorhabdus sp.]
MTLILRNVRPWGEGLTDVALSEGRIAAIGQGLPRGGDEVDGRGGTLLPGLHDHHLHILALAARRQSVDLTGVLDETEIARRLAASSAPFIRAVGYDERASGLPDAAALDRWLPDRPLRIQDRTGALWILNSAALALLNQHELPAGAERDENGASTGRFWREDRWLGLHIPRLALDLAGLGKDLANLGLTALTDASAANGPDEAQILSEGIQQRLTIMGSEALASGAGYALGPLKLLIDERDPPSPDALAARIRGARMMERNVAAHCVTEAELLIFLAALDTAGGVKTGDRIEHGSLIPEDIIPMIAELGLTVVTNPAFLHDRGDRYVEEIEDGSDLYRIGSLLSGGIKMLAGSDAPYASVDPWLGMRSARDRLTSQGKRITGDESIPARAALMLYCNGELAVNEPADLILCEGGMADVLADLDADRVRRTFIAGREQERHL